MTPTPLHPSAPPRAVRVCLAFGVALLAALGLGVGLPATLEAAEPDSAGMPPPSRGAGLASLGIDNVSVDSDRADIAYENRRFRHSAYARGFIDRFLLEGNGASAPSSPPRLYFERRLGMIAAAVVGKDAAPTDESGPKSDGAPAAVRYPSDRDFPAPPAGRALGSTRWATDLELVPRFGYVVGQLKDPLRTRIDLEARLRTNPWPGARASASVVFPVQSDFTPDSLAPDFDRIRPGTLTLEQFVWVPRVALLSATGGIFSSNRWGVSLGAARPLAGGAFLVDAQTDWTGYVAFPATGTEYSTINLFSGFAGLTWRPPWVDFAARVRYEKFLYGDRGIEIELRRPMGDLDIAFFYQHADFTNVSGVSLAIPVPPSIRRHATTHPPGVPVRILPVDRFAIEYRDETALIGRPVRGVASREDYLRQLSLPGLSANAYRYRAGRWPGYREPAGAEHPRVSLTGMTGFINTPWCGVMTDRAVEVGYNTIPKGAAYDHRGQFRNDVYYASIGFFPRIEAGFRWTFIPGLKSFVDVVPDSKVTDSDRMLSGRIEILAARPGRPGLAAGIEDASGTRRFHSTYVVTGMPFDYQSVHARASLGYAPHVFETVTRRTLDGGFGAIEAIVWRGLAASVEYDSEKWNGALSLNAPFGLRARAALLGGNDISVGAGWSVGL